MDTNKFATAVTEVAATLECPSKSCIYTSPDALGRLGVPDYLNIVIEGTSTLPPEALNRIYKEKEQAYGQRTAQHVPLDIDIVITDGEIIRPSDYESEHFRRGYSELERK